MLPTADDRNFPFPSPVAGGNAKKGEMNMAYGLSPRLFVENGPAIQSASVRERRRALWRALDAERRLTLVDRALVRPANENLIDGLPVAL